MTLACTGPLQNFGAPSFDDKKLEVVAVFGSIQMAVSRVINLQHHRIAQVGARDPVGPCVVPESCWGTSGAWGGAAQLGSQMALTWHQEAFQPWHGG